MPSPLITALRVRYVECDMQGHVFNGHYLTWFDMAHTDALRTATGVGYPELVERHGIELVVAESACRYLAAAHFEDALEIAVAFAPPSTTSLTSRFTVRRDGATIATGLLRHVCVARDGYAKAPWPAAFRAALEPYLTPAPSS